MVGALFRVVAWVVVLILGLLALMLVVLNTSLGHSLVKQGLKNMIHPQLEVRGPMDLSVWPNLSLQANDIFIAHGQTHDEGLRVGQLKASVAWLSLLNRVVHIEQAQLNDIVLTRATTRKQTSPTQGLLSADAFKRRWRRLNDREQANWQLRLDRLLIERVEIWGGQTRLMSVDQAELAAFIQVNPTPLGDVNVTVNGLRIDSEASETFQAALEQVGLGGLEALLVETIEGRWQLSDGLARAVMWQANGPWGELSADNGSIDLRTGETVLPMRVQLKGQLSRQAKGFKIQTRQADVRFILVGPIDDLGIESPPSGSRTR